MPIRALLAALAFSGYLKDVVVDTRSPIDGRPYYSSTARARLSVDATASIFRGHVDYDHEVIAGTYFRTKDYRAFGFQEPPTWLNMEQTISSGTTNLWRHRLYRGWVGVDLDGKIARFGRQRIAWGTGKLWNPTDVLNPYQPTSVEREERRGVDALYARLPLGLLSQAELAWAPQDTWSEHALLGRVRSNAAGWDASLMGGKVGLSTGAWMAGGDFAGELAEGNLHGEWSFTRAMIRPDYFKADVGWDYTFASNAPPGIRDAALVVEYLYNGGGEADPRLYRFADLFSGREVTLARHYAGITVSKDLHPLWKLEVVAIANATDGSVFFNPTIQYNAIENLYLLAGLQRFGGPRRTEFGRIPNILHAQAQYFF